MTTACDNTGSLAGGVGFDLLPEELGQDLESALSCALAGGAVFPGAADPLAILREALAAAMRDIESHPRGRLFQEFLLKGPYEDGGEIPAEKRDRCLSDDDTAAAITFIYSHMVNCFQGALTELLAAAPCWRVVQQLQGDGELIEDTRLYVGDAVRVRRKLGAGWAKGADLHILVDSRADESRYLTVAGVAEVKSYLASDERLRRQLDKHQRRAAQGLRVGGTDYPAGAVRVGYGHPPRTVRIVVLPDDWKLPRSFRWEATEHGRSLFVDPPAPPDPTDRIERTGDDDWRITLRWSKEALAAAAYDVTFWYMEKVGEVIYSEGVPASWSEMTPAEAGRNAAKMMLYYAILRRRTAREEQRAIALYNCYGFGYALGMNFQDATGRREMLWPEDLDELQANGITKHGCRIVE